jgi:hypothetical protein
MASEQDDPPARPSAGARIRQRPNRTIDLTATEVAMGDEDDPLTPEDSAAPSETPPMREAPTIPPADGGAQPPPNEPPPAGSRWQSWLPGPFITWPLLEAGAAGGGLVLLVVAVLWFAGLFAPGDNGMNDLNARLVQIESRLKQIPVGTAQPPVDPKTVDALTARLGKLEAAASQPPSADPAVTQRLAAAEAATKSLQATIAELNKRTDAVADTARSSTGVERGDIDALSNRLATLEKSMKSVADDLDKRIDALGDRPVRLAVSAQALRAAVERGDAYMSELAAVKPLATDARALSALEPFAATGLPSAASLARELSDIMPAMQRLAAPPVEGGFLDKLQANAGRLVRIRPIDDVPGDDPAAVLTRIEAKAGRSDIAGALAEFPKLPAKVRAPAEDWIKKAEARTAAVTASRRFASDSLAALGKPTP